MARKSMLGVLGALVLLATVACGGDDPAGPDGGGGGDDDNVVFTYEPPAGAPPITTIHVAGTFNEWTIGELAMTERNDGTWRASIELEPGVYEFKFVFNGSQWSTNMCNDPIWGDPGNGGKVDSQVTTCVDDEHGGMNAELTVGG